MSRNHSGILTAATTTKSAGKKSVYFLKKDCCELQILADVTTNTKKQRVNAK